MESLQFTLYTKGSQATKIIRRHEASFTEQESNIIRVIDLDTLGCHSFEELNGKDGFPVTTENKVRVSAAWTGHHLLYQNEVPTMIEVCERDSDALSIVQDIKKPVS